MCNVRRKGTCVLTKNYLHTLLNVFAVLVTISSVPLQSFLETELVTEHFAILSEAFGNTPNEEIAAGLRRFMQKLDHFQDRES